jgi:hypothetical protein
MSSNVYRGDTRLTLVLVKCLSRTSGLYEFINEVLSKQDKLLMVLPRLVKKSLENNVKSRRGKRKIHTLLDEWTCANGKE